MKSLASLCWKKNKSHFSLYYTVQCTKGKKKTKKQLNREKWKK
jgi:hypothetical protein